VNEKRRALQETARRIVETQLKQAPSQTFLFVYSHEFHPGVISLIASDLAGEYKVPAFVGAVRDDGRLIGSSRAPENSVNLQVVLQDSSRHLTRFGGHRQAAGFEMKKSDAESFRESLAAHLSRESADAPHEAYGSRVYDAEARLGDFSRNFMTWYEALGPYGVGFDAPAFLVRGVRVKAMRKLKGKYLRYTLTDGVREVEAPWFQNPIEFKRDACIDVIVEPQWNEYQGVRTVQTKIQAAREA
jgi:single-stranded-DNA-specific exonuclease